MHVYVFRTNSSRVFVVVVTSVVSSREVAAPGSQSRDYYFDAKAREKDHFCVLLLRRAATAGEKARAFGWEKAKSAEEKGRRMGGGEKKN